MVERWRELRLRERCEEKEQGEMTEDGERDTVDPESTWLGVEGGEFLEDGPPKLLNDSIFLSLLHVVDILSFISLRENLCVYVKDQTGLGLGLGFESEWQNRYSLYMERKEERGRAAVERVEMEQKEN